MFSIWDWFELRVIWLAAVWLHTQQKGANNNCFGQERSKMCSPCTTNSIIDSANASVIANKCIVLCFIWLSFLLLGFFTFFRVWWMVVSATYWKKKTTSVAEICVFGSFSFSFFRTNAFQSNNKYAITSLTNLSSCTCRQCFWF